jgi:hypothetical protein
MSELPQVRELASDSPFGQWSRGEKRRTLRAGTAVQVRVSDPAFVYDLLYSLKQAEYAAAQTSSDTLEVRVPSAPTPEKARLQLACYLANWRARHRGVDADFVDSVGFELSDDL